MLSAACRNRKLWTAFEDSKNELGISGLFVITNQFFCMLCLSWIDIKLRLFYAGTMCLGYPSDLCETIIWLYWCSYMIHHYQHIFAYWLRLVRHVMLLGIWFLSSYWLMTSVAVFLSQIKTSCYKGYFKLFLL